MHGANYVASYAATDVEMWLHYDHAVIARELGYAKKMGLNCVRVFLQSLVYHHDPKAFLARFEDFLATADAARPEGHADSVRLVLRRVAESGEPAHLGRQSRARPHGARSGGPSRTPTPRRS